MFKKKWMARVTTIVLALSLPVSNLSVSASAFSDGENAAIEIMDIVEEDAGAEIVSEAEVSVVEGADVEMFAESEVLVEEDANAETFASDEISDEDELENSEVESSEEEDLFSAGEEVILLEDAGFTTSANLKLDWNEEDGEGYVEDYFGEGEVKRYEFTPQVSGIYRVSSYVDDMFEFKDLIVNIYRNDSLIKSIGEDTLYLELDADELYVFEVSFKDKCENPGESGCMILSLNEAFYSERCNTFEIEEGKQTVGGKNDRAFMEVKTELLVSGTKLSYQWYKMDSSTGKYNAINGATASSYSVNNPDNGNYYCRVSDQNGNVLYSYVKLVVKKWEIDIDTGIESKEGQNINIVASTGSSVTLKVPMKKAEGYDLKYVWRMNGEEIVTSVPEYTIGKVTGHMHMRVIVVDEVENREECGFTINGLGRNETKNSVRVKVYGTVGQQVNLTAYIAENLLKKVRYRWYDYGVDRYIRDTGLISAKTVSDTVTVKVGKKTIDYECQIEAPCTVSDISDYMTIYFDVIPTSEITKYSITYDANGGTGVPATQTKEKGKALTLSTTKPTRKGYTFQGWATSASATKATYKAGASYKTDAKCTLYAVWKANSYKIAFNSNGGTGTMSTISATYGKKKTLSINKFTRKGYAFANWNTKKDGSGKAYANEAIVKKLTSKKGKTVTLYAQWKPVIYTITYDLNKGKVKTANPSTYTIESATITLNNPTRKGYTFKGWYTSEEWKTKVTQIVKGSTGNLKLYARWTANKYTIKYYCNKGTGKMSSTSATYGKNVALRSNAFKRKGYVFKGWNTKADGSGKTYTNKQKVKNLSSKSNGTVKLYAQWEKKK